MEGDSQGRGEGRECENGVEEGREWRVWWEERRNGESGEREWSEYCTVLHTYTCPTSYVAGADLGGIVGSDKVEWGLLHVPPCHDGVGPVLDKKGGSKSITPQDGQVEQTVALRVLDVEVALVADQCVGDTLMAIKQSKV